MSGDAAAGEIEYRFGKGKLENDLTFVVRHFENRIQQATAGVLGFQQFPDHRARDFPGPVGIAQLFAFGIGDQFVADSGVEKKSRHERTTSIEGLQHEPLVVTSCLSRALGLRIKSKEMHAATAQLEPVDRAPV
jgi:hypothetical protein